MRTTYSGHADTIQLDAMQARMQYVENMRNCDFSLCVKGDGNYSNRFYEALSLSRLPLLVDTDTILPLAEEINYDEFVLTVSIQKINDLPGATAQWWNNLTPASYQEKQESAFQMFNRFLRADKYFTRLFNQL